MENKDKDFHVRREELEIHNKDITIEIIRQDMRFNQYISALRKLGIEAYEFEIELMSVVAKLMNVKDTDINDSWMELYVTELSKCENLSIEPLGNNLYPLAEECYNSLLNFKKNNVDVGGAVS